MRFISRLVTLTMIMGLTLIVGSNAVSPATTTRGNHITLSTTGLHVFAINGRPFGVRTSVHVLTFSGSQYSLAIGLARNAVDGGLQTPRAMCQQTTNCVAAVNGDYFDLTPTHVIDPGDAVGGIIQNCVLLHTPEISHEQVDLDGQLVSTGLIWQSSLDVNGVEVPITAINQELPLSYRGVHLPLRGTLLYTAPYAQTVAANASRTIYEFSQVASTSPTTINSTADLTFEGTSTQSVRVYPGEVLVSAPSTSTLATMAPGDSVTLATSSPAGCNVIGGHPILMDQGVIAPIVHADPIMRKPYARTVLGWTQNNVTVLLSVSGKDARTGATAYQLDQLLEALGVTTAINLDGGNSASLYTQPATNSKTPAVYEHPVATSVLVLVGASAGD